MEAEVKAVITVIEDSLKAGMPAKIQKLIKGAP